MTKEWPKTVEDFSDKTRVFEHREVVQGRGRPSGTRLTPGGVALMRLLCRGTSSAHGPTSSTMRGFLAGEGASRSIVEAALHRVLPSLKEIPSERMDQFELARGTVLDEVEARLDGGFPTAEIHVHLDQLDVVARVRGKFTEHLEAAGARRHRRRRVRYDLAALELFKFEAIVHGRRRRLATVAVGLVKPCARHQLWMKNGGVMASAIQGCSQCSVAHDQCFVRIHGVAFARESGMAVLRAVLGRYRGLVEAEVRGYHLAVDIKRSLIDLVSLPTRRGKHGARVGTLCVGIGLQLDGKRSGRVDPNEGMITGVYVGPRGSSHALLYDKGEQLAWNDDPRPPWMRANTQGWSRLELRVRVAHSGVSRGDVIERTALEVLDKVAIADLTALHPDGLRRALFHELAFHQVLGSAPITSDALPVGCHKVRFSKHMEDRVAACLPVGARGQAMARDLTKLIEATVQELHAVDVLGLRDSVMRALPRIDADVRSALWAPPHI